MLRPNDTHRLTDRTLFMTTPHGVILTVEPRHAEAVAERLARFLPRWPVGHVAKGDYWIISPRYAETARLLVLVTTGQLLRLWSPSYPHALARLARYGRGAAASAVAA